MQKYIWILLFMNMPAWLAAQQAMPLEWAAFRAQVLQQHPLAKQADLYRDQANAALLRAKGGFDPKLYADYSGKNFKDKSYFRYTEAGLKWPLGLGLELKGNFNQASGNFLNPESNLPDNGQVAAGFSWSLGQGLLMDERRANLRQGQIGLAMSEAERSAALNDLLVDAAKIYWSWVAAENQLDVYAEALLQAQMRYEAIKESYRQGDKPAVDTLEAFIQVQNRQLDLNFAQVEYQTAALALRNYLWTDDQSNPAPEALPSAIDIPDGGPLRPVLPLLDAPSLQAAIARHPDLRIYDAKLNNLDVERRLKQEKRKPVLDLNYSLLGNGWQFFPSADASGVGVLASDIKWGLQFSYPLPNRKARGDWQLTQIKIAQTNLSLRQKRLEVENKVRQYQNELKMLADQVTLYGNMTANYRLLLDAENEKFRYGESSVFLINTREQRWLDARIKYLKLVSSYRKAEAGLLWAAGLLAE